ncbi:YqjD family protein [Caballeronia sp. S22]|uniref:DUF883 family protein n=1 Tax=Caballeronia sp. S22 TaxID=3137182 RepID=UPI003531057A
MANTDGLEPVSSLVTEKADKTYEFPTSANHGASEADTKPSATAGEGDFREASQSWDAKPSGGDARASAKEKLADMKGALVKNYRSASDTTDDFVHDNPWKAIVMAGLAGLIVGMLISR